VIIDHTAKAGSDLSTPIKLHRIDPQIVKKDLAKAGFKFEAEASFLRNSKDPLTVGAGDDAVRGSTDQFVYRFRKPE
jgi:predicted methyltransferase